MKLFVTVVDDEHGLLPHFLEHYRERGINEFVIASSPELAPRIAAFKDCYPITIDIDLDVQDSMVGGVKAVTDLRSRYQKPDEWIMIADLDEFVEINEPLADITQALDAERATVGRGIMIDRFTRSGKLTGFGANDSLPRVYPVKARFNARVLHGNEYKGVFVKGLLPSATAHHAFAGERVGNRVFEISHYRFHGRSVDRLRDAYQRACALKRPWAEEYGNVLRHYDQNGSRFAWEAFGGWRDDLTGTDVGMDGAVLHVRHRTDSTDLAVLAQVFSRRDYDMPGCFLQEIAAYHSAIADSGRRALIVDAGANIGASALWFSRKWPPCRLACIEPDRDNFEVLSTNVNVANLDATLYQAGLDRTDGMAVLVDRGAGEWGYRTLPTGEGEAVPMVSMRTILAQHADCVPFILKVDIEGYEQWVFAANTSEIDQFPVVVVELHDWMLPGEGTSLSFMKWHARAGREIVFYNENVLSIDWARLKKPAIMPSETHQPVAA